MTPMYVSVQEELVLNRIAESIEKNRLSLRLTKLSLYQYYYYELCLPLPVPDLDLVMF